MSRILLVDDDDQLRQFLQFTLTGMGHQVIEASNGEEALREFELHPFDIVVTDIVMPDKEGLETIAELKRKHPGVPIVAMSGGGENAQPMDYLRMAKMLGATRLLAKP